MNIAEIQKHKGIKHLDNLTLTELVSFVNSMHEATITEKIDGYYLCMGLDNIGLFTSREGKGGTRIYNISALEKTFKNVYHIIAHTLLEQNKDILIKSGLSVGDIYEIEVLYGKIPNVIEYDGINRIVFLRNLNGNSFDCVSTAMNNIRDCVELSIPVVNDNGVGFTEETSITEWEFSKLESIKLSNVNLQLDTILKDIVDFASSPSKIEGMTNLKSIELKVTSRLNSEKVTEDSKQLIKDNREYIFNKTKEFSSKLKERILNDISLKSNFGATFVEGYVIRTPSMQVKIVDKTLFTEVNEFYHMYSNALCRLATNDIISGQTSLFSETFIKVGQVLGNKNLGTVRRKQINIDDRILNNKDKNVILGILSESINELDTFTKSYLNRYKDMEKVVYKSYMKYTFRYNDSVHTKTLEAISNLRNRLYNAKEIVSNSSSVKELFNKLASI